MERYIEVEGRMFPKGSQLADVFDFLNAGNTLTSFEAWEKFGITRLSSVIHIIRKEGYPISTEMKSVKTRYGSTKIAVYSLDKEEE